MAVIFGRIPTPAIIAAFEADSVKVSRWVDIYQADNTTIWRSHVGITDGNVSVDMGRDERRNLDLTLFDADGNMPYGAGNLWYDKIVKPYRGIVLPDTIEPGYISLPGITGNHISITRTALGSLTALEFAVRVTLTQIGVIQTLAGWSTADADLRLDAANKLTIKVNNTVPAAIGNGVSTVAVPNLAVGAKIWLKGKVTIATAVCDYAYSTSDTNDYDLVTWTTLGTAVTGTNAATTPRLTNSTGVLFGTSSAAAAGFVGKLHVAAEAVNTAKTVEIYPGSVANNAATFGAITGQTVTVASAGGGLIAHVVAAVTSTGDTWVSCLGEFMIDSIKRPNFPHTVSITGRDFTKKLQLSKFSATTSFAIGANVAATIQTIATNGGVVKFNFASPTDTLIAPVVIDRNTDRWSICLQLATSISHELFFDGDGNLTLRPFVDPLTAPLSYTFRTGLNVGNLVTFDRSTNDARLFNDVIVYGDGPDNPLVFAQAQNTSVSSPTAIAQIGRRTYAFKSQFISSNTAAGVLASKLLSVMALEQYDVNLASIVTPWMEAGCAVEFIAPDAVVGDPTRYLFTNFTIPLGLTAMTANAKRVTIVG